MNAPGDQLPIEQGRKFFCSELVAKCFKECGISPQSNVHSSTINPGDFSSTSARPITLVDNAKLGPEMLIVTQSMFNHQ